MSYAMIKTGKQKLLKFLFTKGGHQKKFQYDVQT